ncbi:uncharacterized protein EI90DRAFT_2910021 [Cantharellus anzutake]|uniref:uncharacterized protein n=1 Tax=Cantharellus anzutake TaxID=1750568 RepID=UPI0019047EAD|nr:uncharacterized protein EI90DRAFT_2910021 [Cantharellus anzutake]KAF8337528.1 hypothetical protein EI90DRAFT_2910021 [Cantharellus anzutake]
MSSDPRFARLKTDPRFKRPNKAKFKVVIDERFKGIFNDEDHKQKKKGKAIVDKYGRPVSRNKKRDDMRQFYKLRKVKGSKEEDEGATTSEPADYARGIALMESSDEDDFRVQPTPGPDEPDSEEELPDEVRLGPASSRSKHPISPKGSGEGSDDELPEVDLDETEYADLDAQALAYSKSRAADEEPNSQTVQKTSRLALVNIDWDHVRSSDLFRIFNSVVSQYAASSSRHAARVERVRVYPSEFGKERIMKEEQEGPPPELFKKRADELQEPEDVNAENIYEIGDADKGEGEYDNEAVRRYQLQRLRYYYAIGEFDSPSTAQHVYEQLDGTELERSANIFDMSYVPDDLVFDNDFRDECTEEPSVLRKLDFSTDALRHSKVRLTWDGDDPDRVMLTRRRLTKQEIEEQDFRAFIASSSSSEDSEAEPDGNVSKKAKHSASALRALLLDPSNVDELPEGWGDNAYSNKDEISVTFAPGLSASANVNSDEASQTTLERYMRRQREKKAERRAMRGAMRAADIEGAPGSKAVEGDDFFGDEANSDDAKYETSNIKGNERSFATSKDSDDAVPESLQDAEQLVDDDDHKHFSMKDVLEAEKNAKRKKKFKKRGHKTERELEVGEEFVIDVKDDRFKALHDETEFAIDPTNPQFKPTGAMKALLQERAERQKQKQKNRDVAPGEERKSRKPSYPHHDYGNDVQSLVESVKRKSSATASGPREGYPKRRKL